MPVEAECVGKQLSDGSWSRVIILGMIFSYQHWGHLSVVNDVIFCCIDAGGDVYCFLLMDISELKNKKINTSSPY